MLELPTESLAKPWSTGPRIQLASDTDSKFCCTVQSKHIGMSLRVKQTDSRRAIAPSLRTFRSTPDSKSQWICVIPARFLPLAPLPRVQGEGSKIKRCAFPGRARERVVSCATFIWSLNYLSISRQEKLPPIHWLWPYRKREWLRLRGRCCPGGSR